VSSDPLLPHVRELLNESINSVAQLELLIFMHSQRDRAWNPADASAELRSNPAWTQTQLEQLADRGLLIRVGDAFRFGARPDQDAAVDDLARAYRTFPVTVVSAIYPSQRNQGLRHFADAFRLRRRPEPPDDKEAPRG
jgi:hypothetical protein